MWAWLNWDEGGASLGLFLGFGGRLNWLEVVGYFGGLGLRVLGFNDRLWGRIGRGALLGLVLG